jgi:CRISPR-associated protein Cmr2
VLDLVNQLQITYRARIEAVVQTIERKEAVTASVGIAIAHHYTSLSYVKRIAKAAEQLAKNQYGRNALVMTVLRRSGEQTRVGCHWHYDHLDEDAQPIPLFLSFYDFFIRDLLSPKCVYTLLEEAPTLVALTNNQREAQISEIKRVLRRQSNADDQQFLETTLPTSAKHLVLLAEAIDNANDPKPDAAGLSVELHAEGRRYGLVEVLGWLLVMVFLARKDQA